MSESSKTVRVFNGFFFTRAAAYIPRISGITSVLFSILIMYLILSSRTKLKSTYHRIMFLMSLCDAAASMAMALTTIPMPSDVQSVYEFETASYGNTTTCEIQGFVYQFGTLLVIFLNLMLHFYYLCMIRFNVRKAIFAKYFEPILLLTSVFASLVSPYLNLKYDRINPVVYEPFCSSGPYPWTCTVFEEETCIRGGDVPDTPNNIMKWYLLSIVGIGLVIIVTFLILILLKVGKNSRAQDSQALVISSSEITEEGSDESAITPQREKDIQWQALMYVCAFILTYLFTIVSFPLEDNDLVHALKLVFQPMQGLFNAIIFVFDRVQNVRRLDPNLTFWGSVKIIILTPNQAPEAMFIFENNPLNNENRVAEVPLREPMRRVGVNLNEYVQRMTSGRNVDMVDSFAPPSDDDEVSCRNQEKIDTNIGEEIDCVNQDGVDMDLNTVEEEGSGIQDIGGRQ